MRTSAIQPGATAPQCALRVLFERSGPMLACRLAVSAMALGGDEFAGMALGYLGCGATQLEPFHVRFQKERATHLLIGDLDALQKRTCYFEGSPPRVRQAVACARELLGAKCVDSGEGVWCAREPQRLILRWLKDDRDCAIFEQDSLDERLWVHISAHLGVPAGLEA